LFQKKSYRIAIGVSILIHLLLLLFYMPFANLTGLLARSQPPPALDEPITFELTEPEKQPHELVETPEDARTKSPENAQFLSDKNARAQDMNTNAGLPIGLPFSQGRSEYKTFAGANPAAAVQPQEQQSEQQEQDSKDNAAKDDKSGELDVVPGSDALQYSPNTDVQQRQKFSRKLLQSAEVSPQPNGTFSDEENWNNSASSAEALGGVSLSTYEWDYAPYLFYMKKRIREHLYPPQAFVQLGAISGQVTLRFILLRDGTVRDLEFINSEGHKSFIDPSLNSIRASDPFKPLPQSFPDPQLELTWTFIFTVYR
jgi:outer membrane biosynthesis protein TonB